jgi:hypothetical protein
MMVKPVSTFVSASSFWKLFSLRIFILVPGLVRGEGRGRWVLVAKLLAWENQPGLFQEVPLELSNIPLGSRSSRERTLNLLPWLLRLLDSSVLCPETEVIWEL